MNYNIIDKVTYSNLRGVLFKGDNFKIFYNIFQSLEI